MQLLQKGVFVKLSKKGLLIGTGLALGGVAVGAATSYAITKGLVKIAIHREPPKNLDKAKTKIRRTPAEQKFDSHLIEAAERLKNNPSCEEVEIESRDGLRLVGHWYPAKNPKRVLVAMHGWRSAWYKDFGMIADFWHDDECSVLFAEQRGQNNSGGDYMTFGYMERYDCLDWVNWVNSRTEQQYPIYLAGVSMGASTVLMTAGLVLPSNVKGVIADCGFTSAYDEWRYVVKDNMKLSYGLRGLMIDRICQKKINTNSKDITTITAMQKTQLPILFIHGSDDHFVPIRMTYENYKACTSVKELLVVPGAGHGQSYFMERDKYEAAVRAFWERHDES